MSQWNNTPTGPVPSSNSTPRKRKANANRVLTPYVSMSDNPDAFEKHLALLLENNGQARSLLQPLLTPDVLDIQRITVVPRADNSPAFLEIRFAHKPDKKDPRTKVYRVIYRADISGSDNVQDDGNGKLAVGIDELSKRGLYIPTNAPALLAAQAAHRAGGLAPAIFWCEGEKTREAVERRLAAHEVIDAYAAQGYAIVTAATLGGVAGVKHTNYALRPAPAVDPVFTLAGRNDVSLTLTDCRHCIVLDNDVSGLQEGILLARRLETEYNVARGDIFIVAPPKSAPDAWDDADPLPYDVSESDRLAAFIKPEPWDGWWVMNRSGIDYESMSNRRRALRIVGISDAYVDTSTEQAHYVGKTQWANKRAPNDAELCELAEQAIKEMGHDPTVRMLSGWAEPLRSMAQSKLRDMIHEETMEMIERGRPKKTAENDPRRLLIEMFGLEDTPYNREASWHLMRDIVATRLQPAFRADPVSPQLLYVFYGNEGSGKSTASKVLAGGSPSPTRDTKRYTDTIEFGDLKGSDTHGDKQLYLKLAGVTVAEFADKPLGTDIRRNRADMLKHFTNKAQVSYRALYSHSMDVCNLRCVRIFTTNNEDILTEDMGSRRWVIIDTSKTTYPKIEELREQLLCEKREPDFKEGMLLRGFNPGLNWVADNLDAMMAHIYDEGKWDGPLNASPEFLALMRGTQVNYVAEENFEIMLTAEIMRFGNIKNIGIKPSHLSTYMQDIFSGRAPSPKTYGPVLRKLGFTPTARRNGDSVAKYWHRVTERAPDISNYLEWNSGSRMWTTTRQPSADHTDILSAASPTDNEVPF